MWVVRWTNLICGVFIGVGALGFFIFWFDGPRGFQLWPGFAWGLLAALCFANAWWLNNTARLNWRILLNLAALLFFAIMMVLGDDEPKTELIVFALVALGPLAALAGAWHQWRDQRRHS